MQSSSPNVMLISMSNSSTPDTMLSLITVVRNGAGTLEKTIESIARFRCPGVEYVVIDGGSTDGTVELLKRRQDHVNIWISEPDTGIYDAMNKGVQRSRGRWILFLGADDLLATDLTNILPLLQDDHTLYYGDSYWRHARRNYDGVFTPAKLAMTNICHQAIFYPRAALARYAFNPRYRTQADWVVNMQCFSDDEFRFEYLPHTLSEYNDATGLSSVQQDQEFDKDYITLLWRHFPWPIALWRTVICLGGRSLRKLGWKGRAAYTKR